MGPHLLNGGMPIIYPNRKDRFYKTIVVDWYQFGFGFMKKEYKRVGRINNNFVLHSLHLIAMTNLF